MNRVLMKEKSHTEHTHEGHVTNRTTETHKQENGQVGHTTDLIMLPGNRRSLEMQG